MTVAELIKALEAMPRDLEVLIVDSHRHELDEAAVDLARRIPPGVPIPGMFDWRWERDNPQPDNDNPDDPFTERIVVVY